MNETGAGQKKVFIKTYGCQMNVYDSERMADVLAADGYAAVDAPDRADLILLNTCHIREKAAEKIYSELGRLRALKDEAERAGRRVKIGVAGCVAQAEGDEIVRRAPAVDLVVGPQSYHRLPEMLAAAPPGRVVIAIDFAAEEKFSRLAASRQPAAAGRQPAAFLTVQEGCDKFCTFCVVPYTRGAEISRDVAAILTDAERMAAAGVRELTLLGQNVNAWHGAGPDGRPWGLGRLLFRLAEIPGIDRLRYTTSHPRDMDDALIAAHRDLDALMPYLHLPVQSGSDRVLAAMNRRHTRADYLKLVARIRAARPDLALAGDFIVGFPGESEADFSETLSLVEESETIAAFTFKYSPRPGTPAADAADQVEEAIKDERLQRLQALVDRRQKRFMDGLIGDQTEVLFERRGRRAGQIVGRSPWLMPVHVEASDALLGTIARVTLTGVEGHSFSARLDGGHPGAARLLEAQA